MRRNADGNLFIETTMGTVRKFPCWQDELNIADDALVIVCKDGSVNDANSGDLICESGFSGPCAAEFKTEWREYWGFQDSDELNGRR